MKCDNDGSTGHYIINPQCFQGKATLEVTVKYNDVESDVLNLCSDCAGYVKKDARRHGCKVSTRRIEFGLIQEKFF